MANGSYVVWYRLVCWQAMTGVERIRFDEMAERDKVRFENDMRNYVPPPAGETKITKKRRTKDPNAPKRAL